MSTAPSDSSSTLSIEIDGEIGTLTLDRPDALNAMSPEMIGELGARLGLARRPGRAAGAGRDRRRPRASRPAATSNWFQGGLDDPEHRPPVRRAPRRRRPAPGDRRLPPHPVSGDRRGQRGRRRGRLLAGADVRHPDRLGRGRVRLRLRADRRLARRGHDLLPAPRGRSRRRRSSCCSTTRCCPPTGAWSWGSSRRWCPPTSCSAEARAKAEKLAAKAPHYVRMAKLLVAQSLDNTLADHLQLERHGIADSMATEDLREGVDRLLRRPRGEVHRRLA